VGGAELEQSHGQKLTHTDPWLMWILSDFTEVETRESVGHKHQVKLNHCNRKLFIRINSEKR